MVTSKCSKVLSWSVSIIILYSEWHVLVADDTDRVEALCRGADIGTNAGYLHDTRIKLVDRLTRFVSPKRTEASGEDQRLIAVIRLLGGYRATEAIPELSRLLSFEPLDIVVGVSNDPTFEYFPAAAALANIGTAKTTREMLDVIRSPERSVLERQLACWVLLKLEADPSTHRSTEDIQVKEMVVYRLKRLKDRKDIRIEQTVAIQEAVEFVMCFAETDGRRLDLPVIQEWLIPMAVKGENYEHQIRYSAPPNYPEVKLRCFVENKRDLPEGVEVTEAGVIHGIPTRVGRFQFILRVSARIDDPNISGTATRKVLHWSVVTPEVSPTPDGFELK